MKSESEILKDIVKYLESNNIFYWRSQVYCGTVKSGAWLHTGRKGLADLTCMLNGKHLYIEVKDHKGKQKMDQKAFEQMCLYHNHYYVIARSVDDVERKIGEIN